MPNQALNADLPLKVSANANLLCRGKPFSAKAFALYPVSYQ